MFRIRLCIPFFVQQSILFVRCSFLYTFPYFYKFKGNHVLIFLYKIKNYSKNCLVHLQIMMENNINTVILKSIYGDEVYNINIGSGVDPEAVR